MLYNEELLRHQINNRYWFYPKQHGAKDHHELISSAFTFDDNTVTFSTSDNNKIYLLQSRVNLFKVQKQLSPKTASKPNSKKPSLTKSAKTWYLSL